MLQRGPSSSSRWRVKARRARGLSPVEGPDPRADRLTRVQQVIVNLAINAIHASPPGSEVVLALSRIGGEVQIDVIDHGCGISKDALSHVFEPFFTTKPSVKEQGLASPSVHGIIEEHGGGFASSAKSGSGSAFTVCLPGREQ